MAYPNQSETGADEVQKMISQYFPQPELLATYPPGTRGYWQQQQQQQRQQQRRQQQRQQQQRQQQQTISHPALQTPLLQQQQQSLYYPAPQYAVQSWTKPVTIEGPMPAPYPQNRTISEQPSFQDLMRLIQDERVAAALPSSSNPSFGGSEPGVTYPSGALGSGHQSAPGVPSHTIIELRPSSPPAGGPPCSGSCPPLPHVRTPATPGAQDDLYWTSAGVAAFPRMSQGASPPSIASPAGPAREDAHFQMYQCGTCVASFSRKHDMERHRRTHTGEAPYECEGCGAVFTRSDGRGRHFKLQPECEAAHYAKTQGKAKRKGSLAAVSGDELSTSKIGGTQ